MWCPAIPADSCASIVDRWRARLRAVLTSGRARRPVKVAQEASRGSYSFCEQADVIDDAEDPFEQPARVVLASLQRVVGEPQRAGEHAFARRRSWSPPMTRRARGRTNLPRINSRSTRRPTIQVVGRQEPDERQHAGSRRAPSSRNTVKRARCIEAPVADLVVDLFRIARQRSTGASPRSARRWRSPDQKPPTPLLRGVAAARPEPPGCPRPARATVFRPARRRAGPTPPIRLDAGPQRGVERVHHPP